MILSIFPLLAILCAPAIWIIFGRPRFIDFSNPPETKKISIIIPARDEENNIGKLLASINAQKKPAYEIIVVDDGSEDETAEIARSHGATVITSQALPDGWKGKPWACHQGAQHSSGDWLLFLDSDTFMASDSCLLQIQSLTKDQDHVFSICPWHEIKKPYEELSSFFNVMMVIGMNSFGSDQTKREQSRLVGQSMLISQQAYQKSGGHSAVKTEVLENYHLSKTLKDMNIKCSCYLGKNNLNMRMFPGGYKELWLSWKKGFASGASEVPGKTIAWTSIWITGMIIASVSIIVALLTLHSATFIILSAIAYLVHAICCFFAFRNVGSFSFLNALFFPVSLIFYNLLFFSSIIGAKQGKQITWKGRDVS